MIWWQQFPVRPKGSWSRINEMTLFSQTNSLHLLRDSLCYTCSKINRNMTLGQIFTNPGTTELSPSHHVLCISTETLLLLLKDVISGEYRPEVTFNVVLFYWSQWLNRRESFHLVRSFIRLTSSSIFVCFAPSELKVKRKTRRCSMLGTVDKRRGTYKSKGLLQKHVFLS